MTNKTLHQSRRRFLTFLGKTGIAGHALKGSSLLAGLMANRYAHAAGGVKRVVFVYTPMGAPNGLWLPENGELNVATQGYAGLQEQCHFKEVQVVHGGFGLIRKTLSEVRWVPGWTSDTIDHQIARVLGVTTPLSTLNLGVHSKNSLGGESISHRNGQMVAPIEDPALAYETLFGTAGNPTQHFQAASLKSNILDSHLQSLNCSYSKLSSEELGAIEQYETTLGQLQARLAEKDIASQACQQPEWNSENLDTSVPGENETGNALAHTQLQSELIAQAMACGLTNVATLQIGDAQAMLKAHDTQWKGVLHGASCAGSISDYCEMVNYLSRCVAALITELKNTDDPAVPGTKLLDNTVIVQVADMGNGPDHTGEMGPNLLATQMPSFKTGQATPQKDASDTNLGVLQSVALGLGLEQYIGKESHHCIWPCANDYGGPNLDILT